VSDQSSRIVLRFKNAENAPALNPVRLNLVDISRAQQKKNRLIKDIGFTRNTINDGSNRSKGERKKMEKRGGEEGRVDSGRLIEL
jgi:ParB-like chromosome segregation protein Spo0J